jgi:hypothetical protein
MLAYHVSPVSVSSSMDVKRHGRRKDRGENGRVERTNSCGLDPCLSVIRVLARAF